MQRDWRKSSLGLIVVLALLLTAGSLFQDFRFERSMRAEQSSRVAVERDLATVETAVAELRAAQAAYVATGQNADSWMRRVVELNAQIEATLTRLRESSVSLDARPSYDAALTALGRVGELDSHVRDQLQNDQKSAAAEVIFGESAGASQQVVSQLGTVRQAETASSEGRLARLSQLRFALHAGAMGVVLLVALYVGRPTRLSSASEAATMAQMLRELPPPVKASQTARVVPTLPPAPPSPPPPPPLPTPVVNLPAAAELCVDLARVIDSRDVP